MNDPTKSDFFGALALELRAAGQRSPRRRTGLGAVIGALAATLLVAAAAVVALLVMRGGDESTPVLPVAKPDPVGTVILKGQGTPPRQRRSVVVATGTSPPIGSWQMEVSRSSALKDPDTGELYQPAGLRCLSLVRVGGPKRQPKASGQCGEFPRTPGFSSMQFPGAPVPHNGEPGQPRQPVLVYGRAPERAARVVISAPDGLRREVRPLEGPPNARGDFYAISVSPGHPGARINWLDKYGKPGSRGIRLMPPITR
jgi:hypothetical protein